MTDKKYKQLVEGTSHFHDYYVRSIKHGPDEHINKQQLWLCLMGLIETCDVIK